MLDVVDGRAPYVNFQHARLHQRAQAIEIGNRQQLLAVAVLHPLDVPAHETGAGVLLEKAFAADAVRAAHQGERTVCHVRGHQGPHGFIVGAELLFGDLDIGPVDAIRMGELHRFGFARL